MVNHTVYADGKVVCEIINHLNGMIECNCAEVAIKKDRKHKHEIQVPITWVGNIYYKKNQILLYPKDFEDRRMGF